MGLFLGIGASAWVHRHRPEVVWLEMPAVAGQPLYPPVFDIAEATASAIGSPALVAAAQALAPSWEELAALGITKPDLVGPAADEVLEQEGDSEERFLLHGLAQALAIQGPSFGLILKGVEFYDYASMVFVERLLREAGHCGFNVAIQSPVSLRQDRRLARELSLAHCVPPKKVPVVSVDSECAASRILAACPQGCPQKVLEDLIGETVTGDAYRLDTGPMGETRVTLSSEALRSVSRALTAAELAEIHQVLYDALPNEGWGYLRRQGHALASNDVNRILMNHHAFLRGIAWVGVDLLYRHYVGIAGSDDGAELAPESRLNALVGAARLATRVREGGGFSEAIQHFRDAIDVCQVPTRRVDLLNQLANVYAVQRDRQSLIEARALYARAFNDLEGLPDDEERFRLAIRLLNGLALVEYHEGHDVEALRLEEQAREVANQGQERFPRIGQWANILLNLNSAKLLEKRFGDLEGAIRMLRDNLSLGAVEDRFRSATELAHLHLDHGRHSDVVDVLAPFYEGEDVSYLDQDMELFGRGMLVVSLLACNAPERALKQKRRLEALSRTGRGPVVEEFFKKFLASIHADSAGSGVSSSSS